MTRQFSFSISVAFGLASVLLASPVLAGNVLETAIGNTVSITRDGNETRYYLNENGSASLADSHGNSDVGTWSQEGEKLCFAWASASGSTCQTVPDKTIKIGDAIEIIDANGDAVFAKFLAGKQPF